MDMLDSRVLSFFVLMHVLRASLLTSLSSHSSSLSIYTLCFFLKSALVFLHRHGCLFFYLFIFSSYRSELFFHPVLLHETRASLKGLTAFLGLSPNDLGKPCAPPPFCLFLFLKMIHLPRFKCRPLVPFLHPHDQSDVDQFYVTQLAELLPPSLAPPTGGQNQSSES